MKVPVKYTIREFDMPPEIKKAARIFINALDEYGYNGGSISLTIGNTIESVHLFKVVDEKSIEGHSFDIVNGKWREYGWKDGGDD